MSEYPPEEAIQWLIEVLEDEGYTVVERGNVRRYAIQNDVSRLTLAAAKEGFNIRDMIKRDMANQIAMKLAENLVFDETSVDHDETVRISTTVKFIV